MNRFLILLSALSISSMAGAPLKSTNKSSGTGFELKAGGIGVHPVHGVFELSKSYDLLIGIPSVIDFKATTTLTGTKDGTGIKMPIALRYEMPMESIENTNFVISNAAVASFGKRDGDSWSASAGYVLELGLSKTLHKNSKVIIGTHALSYFGHNNRNLDHLWALFSGGSIGYQLKF